MSFPINQEDTFFRLFKAEMRTQIADVLRKDIEPLIQAAAERAVAAMEMQINERAAEYKCELIVRYIPEPKAAKP